MLFPTAIRQTGAKIMCPDLKDLSLSNASLEPAGEAAAEAPTGKAVFTANTRSHVKSERRLEAERRVMLRYQQARREGKDRRPKKSWDPDGKVR
jgi:hypothetical protein